METAASTPKSIWITPSFFGPSKKDVVAEKVLFPKGHMANFSLYLSLPQDP